MTQADAQPESPTRRDSIRDAFGRASLECLRAE